ncbi:hypothetical protein WR25_07219 [Diploscapter pachys]|uniref:VWFA domain-containing protein n=1 Tax=Diploscapter pachys TaxID=2018661 RepID=A0A2A2J2J2_9BILA|nr:hypothetical protein WR25_07219 [Diploscapter pachys]
MSSLLQRSLLLAAFLCLLLPLQPLFAQVTDDTSEEDDDDDTVQNPQCLPKPYSGPEVAKKVQFVFVLDQTRTSRKAKRIRYLYKAIGCEVPVHGNYQLAVARISPDDVQIGDFVSSDQFAEELFSESDFGDSSGQTTCQKFHLTLNKLKEKVQEKADSHVHLVMSSEGEQNDDCSLHKAFLDFFRSSANREFLHFDGILISNSTEDSSNGMRVKIDSYNRINPNRASLVEFKHVTDGKNARELRKQYQPWINNALTLKHEKEDFDGDANVKIRNRIAVQSSSNQTATTEMELEIVDMEDETTASADNNMAFAFEIVTVEMGDNTTSATISTLPSTNSTVSVPLPVSALGNSTLASISSLSTDSSSPPLDSTLSTVLLVNLTSGGSNTTTLDGSPSTQASSGLPFLFTVLSTSSDADAASNRSTSESTTASTIETSSETSSPEQLTEDVLATERTTSSGNEQTTTTEEEKNDVPVKEGGLAANKNWLQRNWAILLVILLILLIILIILCILCFLICRKRKDKDKYLPVGSAELGTAEAAKGESKFEKEEGESKSTSGVVVAGGKSKSVKKKAADPTITPIERKYTPMKVSSREPTEKEPGQQPHKSYEEAWGPEEKPDELKFETD